MSKEEEQLAELIEGEINNLQNFIKTEVINSNDPTDMEGVSDQAIEKSIKYIVASLNSYQQEEIARIREQYCQKTVEESQKLLGQFSGVLDKAVTALTSKGPLG